VAYARIFSEWGVQQIQLRTEGRENGDLGVVAPKSGVSLNLQMNETHILIRLLRMYIPRNGEFGSALEKLRNFGERGVKPPNLPRYATGEVYLCLIYVCNKQIYFNIGIFIAVSVQKFLCYESVIMR
jgi:hypothetical protein